VELSHDRRSREELVREAEKARLLLEAARYLGETLSPERVYERFHEILIDAVPHDGVVVSSYDADEGLIRAEYVWTDGAKLDPSILPALPLNPGEGGMQSRVIRTGESQLINDVRERVKGGGTYYDVDREGNMRKLPETGAPQTQAAVMVPVKHEGNVVGVVQIMSGERTYSEYDRELVEGLVAQMAAAVRNARLNEETRRLEAAEAAAQATADEREHAERVLEAVGDGIFLLDAKSRIGFWNDAAAVITGLDRSDVLKRPVGEIFTGWPTIADQVPIAEHGERTRSVVLPVSTHGVDLWLSFIAVRSPSGVVYTFRDLTSERSLEEAKSDFIATVSHELRTPLTAVLGAAQTLLRRDVDFTPERQTQLLEIIAAQAARLSKVTDEVLLASSLDRGEVRLDRSVLDVEEIVSETVDTMLHRVPETGSLVLKSSPVGKAYGDRDRVQQVLVNLIDNAFKYSPGGGAVVVSTARRPGSVRVSVADEGSGVPPLEQSRIFEKFYRVDPRLTRTTGGTGLGLFISRELVERMGGEIGVESKAGAGSTFFFDLPAA
jgi:two-component system, OmpR family, phosphate regulon sensor histidine kinase PhoR